MSRAESRPSTRGDPVAKEPAKTSGGNRRQKLAALENQQKSAQRRRSAGLLAICVHVCRIRTRETAWRSRKLLTACEKLRDRSHCSTSAHVTRASRRESEFVCRSGTRCGSRVRFEAVFEDLPVESAAADVQHAGGFLLIPADGFEDAHDVRALRLGKGWQARRGRGRSFAVGMQELDVGIADDAPW